MRFDRIALRGMGPFRDEVVVDLAMMEGPLVAVTGVNGSGKSTLLGLLPGALYRSVATKRKTTAKSLASLATERKSYVQVDIFAGERWTIRQSVDAVSGEGEALVLDEGGKPVLERTKVRDFDKWAAKRLPPAEVLYSSTFAVQGSGGFLDLRPAERKAVLLRVLGIEHYERLAEEARRRAKVAREDLRVLDARIAEHRGVDVAAAVAALDAARIEVMGAESALNEARANLETTREMAMLATEQRRAAAELVRRRADLDERMGRARGKREDLEHRIKNNREQLLGRATEIRAAVARDEELIAEETVAAFADAKMEAAIGSAQSEAVDARERVLQMQRALETAEGRLARAVERLADREAIERASRELEAMQLAVREVEATVQHIEARLADLRQTQLDGGAQRITGLRAFPTEVLGSSPSDLDWIFGAAGLVVAKDDHLRNEMEGAPEAIEREGRALDTARQELRDRGARLREQERLAARAGELTAAEEEEREGRRAIELATVEIDAAESLARAAAERLRVVTGQRAEAEAQAAVLRAERRKLERFVARAPKLAQADTVIAGYEAQAAEALEEEERVADELRGLPRTPSGEMVVDAEKRAAAAKTALVEAEVVLRGVSAAEVLADRALGDARRDAERRAELTAERASVERLVADYTILAQDLGRDGLQALEIDAAGPELTELVNDLLHTCVGSRWTVTIETTRVSSDGKKEIEDLEVRVLDTEQGREAPAETYSDGELVLLGEAVSLALSMLGVRRSGLEGVTLVRDESGAALDPDRTRAWVAMLRRAADLVGASKVLVVSHNPEVADLCDAEIVVADGRVTVA